MREDSAVHPKDLGLWCDIFALGVIYCLYMTGELPAFDQETYKYPCIAAINGKPIRIRSGSVSLAIELIINDMLQTEAAARPTTRQVFERLKALDKAEKTVTMPSPSIESRLRGNLMKKKEPAAVEARVTTPEKPKVEVPAPTPTGAPEGESRLRGKLLKGKST